jgi:hypothetical protein
MDDPTQADASSGSDGSWYWGTSMSITQPSQGRRENARYQGSSSSDRRAMYSSIPGVHLLGWILVETGMRDDGLRWDAVVARVFFCPIRIGRICGLRHS